MTHTAASLPGAASLCLETRPEALKPYRKPEITLELELQTRAGSPIGFPDPMDPFGLNPVDFGRPDR